MTNIQITLENDGGSVTFPAKSIEAETEMDGPMILSYEYTIELPNNVEIEVDHEASGE